MNRTSDSPGPPKGTVHWLVAWLVRLAIHAFPDDFRHRFGPGILETAYAELENADSSHRLKRMGQSIAVVWDLIQTGMRERFKPTWNPIRKSSAVRKGEIGSTMEQLLKDFVHATRSLRRAPGFTVVTILTVSLAIGSNVAIFSVVDAVLIDPLPYRAPEDLVSIRASAPGSDFPDEFGVSSEFFVQYREQADLLENIGMFNEFGATLQTPEFADRLRMSSITLSTFEMLGVNPLIGRLPVPEDNDGVALLSHALWVSRFGEDSTILGRNLDIAGELRTVIGVMRPGFQFPRGYTSIWIPENVEPANVRPGRFFWQLVARRKPGTSIEDIVTQLGPLAQRIPERFGGSASYARLMEQHRPVVYELKSYLLGNIAGPLWVLLGTVAVVLLIACTNVANLFLVRSESRQHDLAIRQALGANRRRLVQTQMAEAIVLGLLGGMGGALLALGGVPALIAAAPPGIRRLDAVSIDGRVLVFTALLALITAVVFGLPSAIRSSSPNTTRKLRFAGRGVNVRRAHIGRDVLVVTQTALALVLLVASGLLVRSFLALRNVDPGYDVEDVFTFQIAPSGNFPDGTSLVTFHYQFKTELEALPGVESVGWVHELPLDEGTAATRFDVEDPTSPGGTQPFIRYTNIGGDYFQTMGIDLLRGRVFTRADHESTLGNVIISQAAADLLWPGADPIGKRLRLGSDSTGWETVVGVVENIRQWDFRQLDAELVYFPMVGRSDEWRVHSPGYVVKTPRAENIASDIRALVHRVDPAAPMYAVHTMESLAADSMVRLTFTALTLGLASALALILGAVGLYGVLSYVVTQRTQEIGLRLALGAGGATVRWMVVKQGGRLALTGIVIGIVAAFGLTRVLASLLFNVHPIDGPTFVGMSSIMLGVALVASYLPARRASLVDPLKSLRTD